jgi:hypothetical protein
VSEQVSGKKEPIFAEGSSALSSTIFFFSSFLFFSFFFLEYYVLTKTGFGGDGTSLFLAMSRVIHHLRPVA